MQLDDVLTVCQAYANLSQAERDQLGYVLEGTVNDENFSPAVAPRLERFLDSIYVYFSDVELLAEVDEAIDALRAEVASIEIRRQPSIEDGDPLFGMGEYPEESQF
mgnify:CR=1 FL=1